MTGNTQRTKNDHLNYAHHKLKKIPSLIDFLHLEANLCINL